MGMEDDVLEANEATASPSILYRVVPRGFANMQAWPSICGGKR